MAYLHFEYLVMCVFPAVSPAGARDINRTGQAYTALLIFSTIFQEGKTHIRAGCLSGHFQK
jgi:hypothetical protein